ncbi:MAG TPA: BatA domain-containing protein, partial [Planctomycetota bacterium]|nr:BatA domain-containing protein [Planctomycetota bacterium]
MGFLNPGLLGLLGLGAVPILIHLLHRRRYQVVKWPAMQFLLKAQVKTRQRLRLENLLLLLLRTLAVLLLALAAARPYLPSAKDLGVLGPERRHLYLLIDNSASMAYQEGMSTLLQRALREAANAVDALRADDPVTLVVGCDETRRRNGRPFALLRKTVDHGKVKEVLSRIPLSHGRLDPAAALAEIAAVAEPGDPHRTLLVLSDFSRADWAPSATDGPAASGVDAPLAIRSQIDRLAQQRFELEGAFRFLGDPDPEDFAILDVRPADGRAPAEGMPVAFEVTVANNGPHAASADVRFLVDRKEVASK